jgi:hypothetical protein
MLNHLHALVALFFCFYAFLFKRSRFDFFVLFIIFGKSLSWTLYKGECPISYYAKKHTDPSYQVGSNIYSDEMYEIIGKKYIPLFKFYFTMVQPIIESIGTYILFKRQGFQEKFIFPILFYIYYYLCFLQSPIINGIFSCIFFYIVYRIVKQSLF